jgi:hypothetical protein
MRQQLEFQLSRSRYRVPAGSGPAAAGCASSDQG